jgi:hypothetical protein
MSYAHYVFEKKLAKIYPKNWVNFRGDHIQKSIFSKQKNRPLAILREEASDSLVPVDQIWKILKIPFLGYSIFSNPK